MILLSLDLTKDRGLMPIVFCYLVPFGQSLPPVTLKIKLC